MKPRHRPDYHLVAIAVITGLVIAGVVAIFGVSDRSKVSPSILVWRDSAPIKGTPHPKVRLIEFGDFQCSTCKTFAPILDHLISIHSDLAIQYRYFPLDIHRNAFEAAVAAQYAQNQGHFWPMHDLLYSNQEAWAVLPDPHQSFAQFLILLGLDEKPYATKAGWNNATKVVIDDLKIAKNLQLVGTPTFFINGTEFTDDLSEAGLEKGIAAAEKLP